MKKIVLSITSLFVFSMFYGVYATPVETAPTMKSNSNTSITIEWTEVEDALGYYIYYDTASGIDSGYRNELPDLIEETEYRIEGLEPSQQYYIAVTTVDINADESGYSPEAVLSTTGEGNVVPFALELVEATSVNELTLSFNANLEASEDTEREFLVINSNTEEEIFTIDASLDSDNPTKLVLTMDRDLTLGANYDFTILSIVDENGRNIESGIDALTNFQVPGEFVTPVAEDSGVNDSESSDKDTTTLNNGGGNGGTIISANEENTKEPELNSAGSSDEGKTTSSNSGGNGGTIVSGDDVKDIESTASQTDNLPQAGPEHILLIVLALIIGYGMFFFLGRKQKS